MTDSGIHPADILLNRLALGEAYDGDASDRAHAATCVACRAQIQDVLRLQALFVTPAKGGIEPAPSPVRVSVQVNDGSRRNRGLVAFGLVAAGIAAFIFASSRRNDPAAVPTPAVARVSGDSMRDTSTAPVVREDEPSALSLWPSLAYASEQAPEVEAPYEAVSVGARDSIRPGTRVYVRSSASSYSDKRPIRATEVEVTSATVSSVPAWRIVTTDPFQSRADNADPLRLRYDSVWLRKSDLQVLKRRWRNGMSSIAQQRIGDSVIKQFYNMRVSMVRPDLKDRRFEDSIRLTAGRLLVTDFASMSVVLRSLPLRALWRGSIDVSGSRYAPGGAARSLNLSVQGDSVVATLWGYVPCWRVMLHTGKIPERWFVSKAGHELLLVDGPDGREWPRSRLDLIGRYLK